MKKIKSYEYFLVEKKKKSCMKILLVGQKEIYHTPAKMISLKSTLSVYFTQIFTPQCNFQCTFQCKFQCNFRCHFLCTSLL